MNSEDIMHLSIGLVLALGSFLSLLTNKWGAIFTIMRSFAKKEPR